MTLEFIEGDSETRDLIVCFAGGEAVPYLHRRVERRQTWISTVVKIDGDWKSAIITELAELGAFLGLVDPPAKGTDVVLRLATHDGKEVDLVGTVVYQVLDHEKGCGIEFVFDGHRDEASKREFIRQALSSEGE